MRFRFATNADENEVRAIRRIEASADRFWQRFAEVGDPDLVLEDRELAQRLEEIHPRLRLDVEPAEGDGSHALVITPEIERRLIPLAEAVVARASSRKNWRHATGRSARNWKHALERVRRETGANHERARARAGFRRGHLLDIVVYTDGCGGHEDEAALDAAYVAVEALLGEECLHEWVGAISVAPMPRGGPLRLVGADDDTTSFPLVDLADAVDAAVRGVTDELPGPLCADASADWTLLEMEAEPGDDYRGQTDRVLASTRMPEMLKCALEEAAFASSRFSKWGERFCTLKMDATGTQEERLAKRLALEDALGPSLHREQSGVVVGGGVGLRYSYVDLALSDVARATETIRGLAQSQKVSNRSWMLFFDDEWADEWVGVYGDSPAPPGMLDD